MHIRKMEARDLDEVYALSKESFSEAPTIQSLTNELENPIALYFVAEEENKMIGYSGIWNIAGEIEIMNIAVDKLWRNKGIGSRLLEAILEVGLKQAAQKIYLEVREGNKSARSLYKKYRFYEVGRREGYYHQPKEDAIIMVYEVK